MKSFKVYLTFKDGSEDETSVCGCNMYEAMDVVRDFLGDEHKSIGTVSTCLLEQYYDEEDHKAYGDDYEW